MGVLVAGSIRGVDLSLDQGRHGLLRVFSKLLDQQLIHLGLSWLKAVGDTVHVLGLQQICQ